MSKEKKKNPKEQDWWYKGLQLTEQQLRDAMANTRSNKEAARWLGITDVTHKKYAKSFIDQETGKSLFELHKNVSGRGISKNWVGGIWKKDLNEMLIENQPSNPKKVLRLKEMLMKDGRLGFTCSACGYCEKRLTDMKVPLLLNFKNGKKTDWRIENLQWLCYNCYFLFIGNPFSNRLIQAVEATEIDVPEVKEDVKEVYQLSDFYYEHLKKLGLDGSGDLLFKNKELDHTTDEGSEFIDFK